MWGTDHDKVVELNLSAKPARGSAEDKILAIYYDVTFHFHYQAQTMCSVVEDALRAIRKDEGFASLKKELGFVPSKVDPLDDACMASALHALNEANNFLETHKSELARYDELASLLDSAFTGALALRQMTISDVIIIPPPLREALCSVPVKWDSAVDVPLPSDAFSLFFDVNARIFKSGTLHSAGFSRLPITIGGVEPQIGIGVDPAQCADLHNWYAHYEIGGGKLRLDSALHSYHGDSMVLELMRDEEHSAALASCKYKWDEMGDDGFEPWMVAKTALLLALPGTALFRLHGKWIRKAKIRPKKWMFPREALTVNMAKLPEVITPELFDTVRGGFVASHGGNSTFKLAMRHSELLHAAEKAGFGIIPSPDDDQIAICHPWQPESALLTRAGSRVGSVNGEDDSLVRWLINTEQDVKAIKAEAQQREEAAAKAREDEERAREERKRARQRAKEAEARRKMEAEQQAAAKAANTATVDEIADTLVTYLDEELSNGHTIFSLHKLIAIAHTRTGKKTTKDRTRAAMKALEAKKIIENGKDSSGSDGRKVQQFEIPAALVRARVMSGTDVIARIWVDDAFEIPEPVKPVSALDIEEAPSEEVEEEEEPVAKNTGTDYTQLLVEMCEGDIEMIAIRRALEKDDWGKLYMMLGFAESEKGEEEAIALLKRIVALAKEKGR